MSEGKGNRGDSPYDEKPEITLQDLKERLDKLDAWAAQVDKALAALVNWAKTQNANAQPQAQTGPEGAQLNPAAAAIIQGLMSMMQGPGPDETLKRISLELAYENLNLAKTINQAIQRKILEKLGEEIATAVVE